MLSHPRILTLTTFLKQPLQPKFKFGRFLRHRRLHRLWTGRFLGKLPNLFQWPKPPRLQRWCCMPLPATHHDWLQCTALRHLEHQMIRSVWGEWHGMFRARVLYSSTTCIWIQALSSKGSDRRYIYYLQYICLLLARWETWKLQWSIAWPTSSTWHSCLRGC